MQPMIRRNKLVVLNHGYQVSSLDRFIEINNSLTMIGDAEAVEDGYDESAGFTTDYFWYDTEIYFLYSIFLIDLLYFYIF